MSSEETVANAMTVPTAEHDCPGDCARCPYYDQERAALYRQQALEARKLSFSEKVADVSARFYPSYISLYILAAIVFSWFFGILPLSHAMEAPRAHYAQPELSARAETDYYRASLSGAKLEFYDRAEGAMRSLVHTVEAPRGLSHEDVSDIICFVLYDNPDIFWVKTEFTTVNNIWGVGVVNLSFYEEDPDVIAEKIDKYNRIADEAIDGFHARLQPEDGDTAIATFAYQWIAEHAEYVSEAYNSQNIESLLDDGESVCAGYSKMMKFLMDRAGIPCIYVTGTTYENPDSAHAWNIVLVDDGVMYVDPTWGDNGDSFDLQWFMSDQNKFALSHQERYPEVMNGLWNRNEPDLEQAKAEREARMGSSAETPIAVKASGEEAADPVFDDVSDLPADPDDIPEESLEDMRKRETGMREVRKALSLGSAITDQVESAHSTITE